MTRRKNSARLPSGVRRVVLTVNLDPEIHRQLGKIAAGNRSMAIEELVRRYVAERPRTPEPAAAVG